jgi:hypothetical protein
MMRATTITLAVFSITALAFADGWQIESVDTAGYVGSYTSIFLDTLNYPHISYYDFGNGDLKYAHYDGSSWHIETVDTTGDVGRYTSIALDITDNPHISYCDDIPNYDLKYAYYNGSSWCIESVDTAGFVELSTSIALDTSDKPHISYYDFVGNYDLRYAYHDGSSWYIEIVDTAGSVGMFSSLALDTSDDPHISYCDSANKDLKYAYYDGSLWQIESVDTTGWVGWYTSVALDTSNNPHISYFDYTNRDLKYAYYDSSSWHVESVDTSEYVGWHTSIAVDTSNNPHISYFDHINYDLKYAYYNGSSWQIESVDVSGHHVGYYTSIVLDTSDNPHISYFNDTTNDLKYAFYNTSPTDFDLLSPGDGDIVADAPVMDWEDADDVQQVTYDLWYSEEADFDPHEEITDLTDSTYTFGEGVLTDGTTYHWKVRAWDGYEGTWSGPDDYWSFTVDYGLDIPVTSFSAASAADGVEVTWECGDSVSGFNLYRSMGAGDNKTVTSRDKLNAELITGESPYAYLDATVSEGISYSYWLEAVDVGGSSETFGPVECTWNGVLPTAYALYQSRPNPAKGTAIIAFDLPEETNVTLTVYDLTGRKVTTVVDETLTVGNHERTVSGLAPGVYVYKLSAGSFNSAKKMVVTE